MELGLWPPPLVTSGAVHWDREAFQHSRLHPLAHWYSPGAHLATPSPNHTDLQGPSQQEDVLILLTE